jgi:hypothetical protein
MEKKIMRCSFEKSWKNWAAAGFLLAGGAYAGVVITVGVKPLNESLNTLGLTEVEKDSIKAGVGLLGSLLVAGLSIGVFKTAKACRSYFFKNHPTEKSSLIANIADAIGARMAYQAVNENDEGSKEKNSHVTVTVVDDEKHGERVAVLIDQYLEAKAVGNIDSNPYLSLAKSYRKEYANLSDDAYLLLLTLNSKYPYKKSPLEIITDKSAAAEFNQPTRERQVSPDSTGIKPSTPFTPPAPWLQQAENARHFRLTN